MKPPLPLSTASAGASAGKATPLEGLTAAEAQARLERDGPNEVPEPRTHAFARFAAKFWGLSAWMLELIALLSFILHKTTDVWIALGLLVVNAIVAFTQEQRASAAVDALRRRMQVTARARRDGEWRTVPARALVRGDIVRVRTGDFVPADLRVADGDVGVDQSALTGESQETAKATGDAVYSGSVVRRGEATGEVVATGTSTYFGRTTELVASARPRLHVEEVVSRVVKWLFVIVGVLVAAVLAISVAERLPLVDVLPLALVLLMSAVPVALPVMFTVSTAVGAQELARHGVIVTRLSAVEDCATMDVLCVDKTGTITENRLAVTGVVVVDAASESEVLLAGALASREDNQDPIDLAFLAAARDRGVLTSSPRAIPISFVPFDAKTRRTEALFEVEGKRMRAMKGAAHIVAAQCGLDARAIEDIEARIAEAAAKGYRALGVASGAEQGPLTMLGLVFLYDPPRPDASRLIARLRALGVSVKMLTGDALAIAREVGREVGLANIRRVGEWNTPAGAASPAMRDRLAGADGFAEVYPQDKYAVVRQLQAAGHVVGMTGDGVNDAPALRQAEVGVAVAAATDVAKGAASVVLTDAGLTNIVPLIEQGRSTYQRILTWIVNKISRTILKSVFIVAAFLVTGRFVVSAFAVLLLTFMTDFAKIALSTDRVRPSQRPETWEVGGFVIVAVVLGLAMVAEALLLLWLGWSRFGLAADDRALHTFCFLTLLYFAVFSIVSIRERRPFWTSAPSRTLLAALAAEMLVGTALAFAGVADLGPLPWRQSLAVLVYAALACLAVNDAIKTTMLKRLARSRSTKGGPPPSADTRRSTATE